MPQEQPNVPPDSPFASDPPSDCPFDSEPQEPKLSLQHLMIWTVCAAVGCSTYGSIFRAYEIEIEGFHKILVGIDGVIRGTGLAAFVLLVSRRFHHRVFPRHGGEMLWLMIGIQAFLGFVAYPVHSSSPPEWLQVTVAVFSLASLAIWLVFFLYAIVRCKQRRWKAVFVLIPTANVVGNVVAPAMARYFGAAAAPTVFYGVGIGKQLFLLLVVAAVATIDIRQARRYPWTHWVGILLLTCQAVNVVGMMLDNILAN